MEFETEAAKDRVRPADERERQRAREAIHALAHPRMTGSPGAARVEAELRERFEALGYGIHELPFQFSAWPGRFGVPLVGAVVLLATTVAAAALVQGLAGLALGALGTAAAAMVGIARLLRRAIRRLPWDRRETANWLVQRPDARPRFLIVAHRDSKSQGISTIARLGACALVALGMGALAVTSVLGLVRPDWIVGAAIAAAAAAAGVGGALLVFARAENHSPGALDNATGLAALLAIAAREREQDDIAFLVTDAEELGLVGAAAVAHRIPRVLGVVNLDGLDDRGPIHIVERFGLPRRGLAPHLAAAHLKAAAALELHARRRDLPLGIGVDHIPFTRAGHPALTVMRGDARALRRVHRPEDTADRLDGRGAADVAALVSGALHLLRAMRR